MLLTVGAVPNAALPGTAHLVTGNRGLSALFPHFPTLAHRQPVLRFCVHFCLFVLIPQISEITQDVSFPV